MTLYFFLLIWDLSFERSSEYVRDRPRAEIGALAKVGNHLVALLLPTMVLGL
jgi:hypothetical protein